MSEIAQYLGTGKRKTSVARVILRPGDGKTWINGRTLDEYFPRAVHRKMVMRTLSVSLRTSTHDRLGERPSTPIARLRPVKRMGKRRVATP